MSDECGRLRLDHHAQRRRTVKLVGCVSASNRRVSCRRRSRLGKGDFGVNAARIRRFIAELKEELTDDE